MIKACLQDLDDAKETQNLLGNREVAWDTLAPQAYPQQRISKNIAIPTILGHVHTEFTADTLNHERFSGA